MLDKRFMTIHPRTALWFEQREQCQRCAHVIYPDLEPQRGKDCLPGGMRCAKSQSAGRIEQAYCIDAREPGQPCGPKAALYQPKGK